MSCSTSGLKWIRGVSGVAGGPFLLLSADESGCLGWIVSYLPRPTDTHRGATVFGTLKSHCLHRMGNQPGWIRGGLRHGCHMAPSLFSVEFQPLGLTAAFWQFMWLFVATGTSQDYLLSTREVTGPKWRLLRLGNNQFNQQFIHIFSVKKRN